MCIACRHRMVDDQHRSSRAIRPSHQAFVYMSYLSDFSSHSLRSALKKALPVSMVAAMVLSLVLVGCDFLGSNEPANGRLIVHLTDAPLEDFQEVHVTISRVELIASDDETAAVVLSDAEQVFDLLQLQNGVTAFLAEKEIPEGSYSQLRLFVAQDADVLMTDGSRVVIPSGEQTGIKVVFPEFEISSDGDVVELTVDFDVTDSFVKAGQAGFYVFKPVLKAYAMVVNGETVDVEE